MPELDSDVWHRSWHLRSVFHGQLRQEYLRPLRRTLLLEARQLQPWWQDFCVTLLPRGLRHGPFGACQPSVLIRSAEETRGHDPQKAFLKKISSKGLVFLLFPSDLPLYSWFPPLYFPSTLHQKTWRRQSWWKVEFTGLYGTQQRGRTFKVFP